MLHLEMGGLHKARFPQQHCVLTACSSIAGYVLRLVMTPSVGFVVGVVSLVGLVHYRCQQYSIFYGVSVPAYHADVEVIICGSIITGTRIKFLIDILET